MVTVRYDPQDRNARGTTNRSEPTMIRISHHPADQAFLLLRIDQLHNHVIGSFQPARRQDDLGVGIYVMETTNLPALQAWARYQDIHILDETRTPGEPTRPVECGNTTDTWTGADGREYHDTCAAPYPAGRIPKFCGACGQPANPVIHTNTEPDIGVKCPDCGHLNHGGPAYCVACSTPLPERHLTAPALPRVHGEPRPLGDTIDELRDQLTP